MSTQDETNQCFYCGWGYDPAIGDPDSGIAPGMAWEDVPADWHCPNCGASKAEFAGVAAETA